MKPRILIVLTVALFAFTLAGCRTTKDEPTTPGLREALDKMGLEKAPTLGPVYREYVIDVVDGKYEMLYGLMCLGSRAVVVEMLLRRIDTLQARIRTDEEKLAAPNLADPDKASITADLDVARKDLAEFEALNDNQKRPLVLGNRKLFIINNPMKSVSGDDAIVTGETIDGDSGKILLKYPDYEGAILFVKEKGAWKVDTFKTSVHPPTPPAPQEVTDAPGLKELLGKLGLENAPTLGPVFRQFYLDYCDKNFDVIYDSLDKSSHDKFAVELKNYIAECQETVKTNGKNLRNTTLVNADEAAIARAVENAVKALTELQALNGDAKKYFAWKMKTGYIQPAPWKDAKLAGVAVTGEKITGDKGELLLTYPGHKIAITFLKENGAWKWDKLGILDAYVLLTPARPAETISPALKAALDKMGLENAPTLGPIYRKIIVAIDNKNYDELYGLINKASQDLTAQELKENTARAQTRVKTIEEILKAPELSEAAREQFTRELEQIKKDLADLQSLEGNVKKYFARKIEKLLKDPDTNPLNHIIMAEIIVTGEKIDGDKGQILIKESATNWGPQPFVRENGVWKADLFGTAQTEPTPPPGKEAGPAAEPPKPGPAPGHP
jgi:hypothetical protein